MILQLPRNSGSLEIGFSRMSDTNAEIAWRLPGSVLVGELLRIDGDVWEVRKIEPSKYVKGTMVGSLWLRR